MTRWTISGVTTGTRWPCLKSAACFILKTDKCIPHAQLLAKICRACATKSWHKRWTDRERRCDVLCAHRRRAAGKTPLPAHGTKQIAYDAAVGPMNSSGYGYQNRFDSSVIVLFKVLLCACTVHVADNEGTCVCPNVTICATMIDESPLPPRIRSKCAGKGDLPAGPADLTLTQRFRCLQGQCRLTGHTIPSERPSVAIVVSIPLFRLPACRSVNSVSACMLNRMSVLLLLALWHVCVQCIIESFERKQAAEEEPRLLVCFVSHQNN